MRQAVILVGGRGTRLGALAADAPKPLIPLSGDKPFLDYLFAEIGRHGVEEILLLAGHMGDLVARRYDGAHFRDARVKVRVEAAPAGTAGALREAAGLLDETFLMANGDSLLDFNYLSLTNALRAQDVGAIALKPIADAARFGRVDVEGDRVVGFREKDASRTGPALISAGVYLLRRTIVDHVRTSPCSLEVDVFPALAQAKRLAGVICDGDFIDIGLPETLREARASIVERTRRGAVFFDRDGTLTVDSGGYTHKPEDLVWQPGAIEAVRATNDAGLLAIVVTNQAGIARGFHDEEAVARFHAAMQAQLRTHGAHIDAFYHCPHHGEGSVPEYTHADHPDRKPNPGMLRRAMAEWPINAARSFLVGDAESDVAAARALGLEGYRVQPGELLQTVTGNLSQRSQRPPTSDSIEAALSRRAKDALAWLFDHALPLWWERGFDHANACFHEMLDLDGSPKRAPRRLFVQARQTYVYASAGRLGWAGPWREAVRAGADILIRHAWSAAGRPHRALDADARLSDPRSDLYDLAFFLFGLAQAASTLEDHSLIAHADTLIAWLDQHWLLPQGGFNEGEIRTTPPRRQNPHMHLFEAFLALYETTAEARYLKRASQIAALFSGKFFNAKHGALPEYYDDDWAAAAGDEGRIVEPGHQFEWSWLLQRWNRLGGGDLSAEAEKLRVHAELYGVRLGDGAIHDEVWIEGLPRTQTSRLWPHTERLKANLVRFERSRDRAAGECAIGAFDTLQTYLNLPTRGLWRDRLLPNGAFKEEPAPASSFYHIMCAYAELIRVCEWL